LSNCKIAEEVPVEDIRFDVPLYNVAEAAAYLRLSPSTLRTWVDGYTRPGRGALVVQGAPVVTAVPAPSPGAPRMPFIGLAEAYVLNAFRRAGVPLQRIRPSLDVLRRDMGEHALASRALFTDGAEVLWDFAAHAGGEDEGAVRRLIVPRSGQYVFRDVVEQYLRQVVFDDAGFARLIRLPHYGATEVVVDPTRNFGRPTFARGGIAVENALGRLRAGESIEDAAEDLGVPFEDLSAAYLLSA
jgi:uncharacterized protein (DUF433 family)